MSLLLALQFFQIVIQPIRQLAGLNPWHDLWLATGRLVQQQVALAGRADPAAAVYSIDAACNSP
jgi:hypothetical protein